MRSSALGTILGALALAASALLFVKLDRLESQLAPRALDRAPRVAERTGPGPAAGPSWPRAVPSAGPGPVETLPAGEPAGSPEAGLGDASPAGSMSERVRELEAEVSRLRAEQGSPAVRWRAPRFASTVEELTDTLTLSTTQADRVREAVDRHRRRIEDVLRIPDETGVSPWDRREQEKVRLREAIEGSRTGGILQVAMGSLMDQNKPIPGRSTTYGEEVARIKSEAREEIARGLDPAQQKSFEDVQIDPLLDQGGGRGFVSISMTSSTLVDGTDDTGGDGASGDGR